LLVTWGIEQLRGDDWGDIVSDCTTGDFIGAFVSAFVGVLVGVMVENIVGVLVSSQPVTTLIIVTRIGLAHALCGTGKCGSFGSQL
jgi:hypothetical protein